MRLDRGMIAGLATAVAGLAALCSTTASADAVADFYAGKTVTIVVAAGPGGNYSNYSLLLAPFWRNYTPGHPNFIIQNMGGAGGTKAANYLANSAPHDGSHIGILEGATPINARLRTTGVKYDPGKFQYLGGVDYTRSMITVMRSAGVASIEDAKKKEVLCGSTGRGSSTYIAPVLANHFLGTKFKMISGYQGMNEVDAAVDKGEIACRAAVFASVQNIRPQWIAQKLIVNIAAIDLERHPDYPDAPTLIELAKDDDAKAVFRLISSDGVLGRAWLAPPGVPADRVAALRDAFWKSFTDPKAQAEMKKRNMPFEPVRWERQQQTLDFIGAAPQRIIDLARNALGLKE